MEKQNGYAALGFQSLDDFCKTPPPAGLGRARDAIEREIDNRAQREAQTAKPLAEPGEIGRGRDRGYNYNRLDRGTSAEFLTARIARDRPDILDGMKAGKYRSVRAAAIDAGIIDPEKCKRHSLPVDPVAAGHYLRQRVDGDWITAMVEAFYEDAS